MEKKRERFDSRIGMILAMAGSAVGLGFVPLLIGGILDKYCKAGTRIVEGAEVTQYNYTLPMVIFALFGVVALLLAMRLKAVDKKEGYGLEEPNIKA